MVIQVLKGLILKSDSARWG